MDNILFIVGATAVWVAATAIFVGAVKWSMT